MKDVLDLSQVTLASSGQMPCLVSTSAYLTPHSEIRLDLPLRVCHSNGHSLHYGYHLSSAFPDILTHHFLVICVCYVGMILGM